MGMENVGIGNDLENENKERRSFEREGQRMVHGTAVYEREKKGSQYYPALHAHLLRPSLDYISLTRKHARKPRC